LYVCMLCTYFVDDDGLLLCAARLLSAAGKINFSRGAYTWREQKGSLRIQTQCLPALSALKTHGRNCCLPFSFALSEQSSWQLANGPQRNQAAFLGGVRLVVGVEWLQIHLTQMFPSIFVGAHCFPTHISQY
jgi:hypothetical protein